jgi:hypothetical protein
VRKHLQRGYSWRSAWGFDLNHNILYFVQKMLEPKSKRKFRPKLKHKSKLKSKLKSKPKSKLKSKLSYKRKSKEIILIQVSIK